eukprot:7832629-Alexandrium_andersonii.AAC.2
MRQVLSVRWASYNVHSCVSQTFFLGRHSRGLPENWKLLHAQADKKERSTTQCSDPVAFNGQK